MFNVPDCFSIKDYVIYMRKMKRTFDEANENIFMQVFKYYKSNNPKPSFKDVISLQNPKMLNKIQYNDNKITSDDNRTELLGLISKKEWTCYSITNRPGLMLIKNPFTNLGQRYWIRKCLEEYSRKPNKTNIDIETIIKDWWKECYADGQCNMKLQKKLRWTTLGYHHNWDTKVYSEDNRAPFPEDLAELCDCIAQYLGFDEFKAEAAIVNYYHMGSTLSGHTDHSEVNLEAPLFSFSFGQSAIFLIGGPDKNVTPSAIMLESGDIAIMSKEARLSYHAVPKIVPSISQPWNDTTFKKISDNNVNFRCIANRQEFIFDMNKNIDNKEWDLFNQYVKDSRININVRQVLNKNQKSLYD